MSHSSDSEQYSRLIRELSRDSRARGSPHSSRASHHDASRDLTTSTFDPENEALMSTQTFPIEGTEQPLPELQGGAKTHSAPGQLEDQYVIDTSALGRAFPEFTSAQFSSGSDDEPSIEMGRGVPNKGAKISPNKPMKSNEVSAISLDEDSFDFSAPMVGEYKVMSTPPNRPRQLVKADLEAANQSLRKEASARRQSTLRNEVPRPSPPAVKTTEQASGGSRSSSREQRANLAAFHARVSDVDENSILINDRPPTVDLTSRSTRFASNQGIKASPAATALPSKFSSTNAFSRLVSSTNKQKQDSAPTQTQNATISSYLNSGGQPSFLLPEIPNLSELVTGVFEDGTPVFSRHGKSRASRFSGKARTPRSARNTVKHLLINEVPISEEEQQIYASLKILQEKLAEMEVDRMESQAAIQELQSRNQTLERERSESRRWRRSDSALGVSEGSDNGEGSKGGRRSAVERMRLETTVKTLQEQVDAAGRKASVATNTIRVLTQERDSAVTQLGVAYMTTEQLKVDNESLKAENEALKEENLKLDARIAQLTTGHESKAQEWHKREEGLRRKIHRRDETLQDLRAIDENVDISRLVERTGKTPSKAAPENRSDSGEQRCQILDDDATRMFDMSIRADPHRGTTAPTHPSRAESKKTAGGSKHKRVVKYVIENDTSSSSASEHEIQIIKPSRSSQKNASYQAIPSLQKERETQDMTNTSRINTVELAQLRRILEENRVTRKSRSHHSKVIDQIEEEGEDGATLPEVNATAASEMDRPKALPRKSSLKDLTGRLGQKGEDALPVQKAESTMHSQQHHDETIRSKAMSTTKRGCRRTEDSLLVQQARRMGISADDFTSAFLIPDITMHVPKTTAEAPSTGPHEPVNCTICRAAIQPNEDHTNCQPLPTLTIPVPIPVSTRMPLPTAFEEEPTIRPSQPPPQALANVIKSCEDELAHLKLQLAKYQELYNRHDPSLSKRERKRVCEKVKEILAAIERKADMIYGLYDVLEGQKEAQEVVVGGERMVIRGGEGETQGTEAEDVNGDGDDCDSEVEMAGQDLPWEGIENTFPTLSSITGLTRRSRKSF